MLKFIRGKGKDKGGSKRLRTRVVNALVEPKPSGGTTGATPAPLKEPSSPPMIEDSKTSMASSDSDRDAVLNEMQCVVEVSYGDKEWILQKSMADFIQLDNELASHASKPRLTLIPFLPATDAGSSTLKSKRSKLFSKRGADGGSEVDSDAGSGFGTSSPTGMVRSPLHKETPVTAETLSQLRSTQSTYANIDSPFLREISMCFDLYLDNIVAVPDLHDTPQVSEFVDWSRHKTIAFPAGVHVPGSSGVTGVDSPLQAATTRDSSSTLGRASSGSPGLVTMITSRTGDDLTLEDFHLLKVLGKGSFGKVLLVRRKGVAQTNENVYAMKILKKQRVFQRYQVEHTKTERRVLGLLASIQHPFFVSLHYAFQSDTKLYMVLDFCAGGEMFFHLSKARRFDEPRARFYAAEIVLALEFLHSFDIIYRDLKPENVLLDHDGHVKLTDFGLCKENIPDHTSAGSFCGTPEYLAPEIVKKIGHGKAADWWTLGALLFEMLSGVPPFYSRNRDALFEKILRQKIKFPPYFSKVSCDLIKRLMTRNYKNRLGTKTGANEVKQHTFFRIAEQTGSPFIDWTKLFHREIQPPFQPKMSRDKHGVIGGTNFDPEFVSMPIHSVSNDGKDASGGKSGSKKPPKKYPPFENFYFDKDTMVTDPGAAGDISALTGASSAVSSVSPSSTEDVKLPG